MINATVSQCWYSELGREGAPLETVGDPIFVEAPVTVERVVAVGAFDRENPYKQRWLLQINPSGKPDGQRLFLWQSRAWLEVTR